MTKETRLILYRLYELERSLPHRTFARDHNFDEWLNH